MSDVLTKEQFLSFTLANVTFALQVEHVREVLEVTTITPIPRTPQFMCGVINVRGSVVPVIDLRMKLGMERTGRPRDAAPDAGEAVFRPAPRFQEKSVDACVVVLDIPSGETTVVVGALVDSVQEVLEFDKDKIEPPPRIGTAMSSEFLKGIGKRDDQFVMILGIDKIFQAEELEIPA